MNAPKPADADIDIESTEPPLPHYTASGSPVRFGDRLAFTVWTFGILLVLAISLVAYLAGWYAPSVKPQ